MLKREVKNHKRNISNEENNPSRKREISRSGDHKSNNKNREKYKTLKTNN